MLKLMKLELVKFDLKKYILAYIITLVCVAGFSGLMGNVSEQGIKAVNSAAELWALGETMVRVSFIIFTGVLLGNFIIGEFKNGTVKVLFTYPIPRKRFIGNKLILIFILSILMNFIGTIIVYLSLWALNRIHPMVPETVELAMVFSKIPSIGIQALLAAGLSMISLYFGMLKKSISATIIASVILGIIINSSISTENGITSLFSFIVIPVVLCLAGLSIAYFSYRNIDRMDIN
jgi:ABC-type transport system involved in multi-copper enzyme maturation permease subunit